MAVYIPPNSSVADVMAIMAAAQKQGQLNPPATKTPGNLTQATVPNVNLQTGQPIGLQGSNIPQQYQNLSAMNQGIVGNGAASAQPTNNWLSVAPGNNYVAPTTPSGSDAFFAQAKAPIATRTISSPNLSAVTGASTGGGGGGGISRRSSSSSSTGGGTLDSIIAALVGGSNSANKANEDRYAEAKATLDKFGEGTKAQLESNYKQDVGRQEQDAASRGLGNSTIREALLGGARMRQQQGQLDLNDKLAGAKVNLLQSREDVSANPLALVQLLQQAAQYGGGNTLGAIAASLGLTNRA